jgi:tetratricopeptide (TPR) repeat protein
MIRFHSPIAISCRWLTSRRRKGILSILFLILGSLGASFTINQYDYSRLMLAGGQAIQENRFDTQAYAKASKRWFARHDKILFNQGILAYKAGNLSHAAQLFGDAVQRSQNDKSRAATTYNFAKVMQDLGKLEGAKLLLQETLRLNAEDMDAKFNLEQIQYRIRQQKGDFSQVSVEHNAAQPPTSPPAQKPITQRKGI